MVHNYYQEGGGEDAVFLAEQDNLRRAGAEVQTFTVSNDSIRGQHPLETAAHTLWNSGVARELADLVTRHSSDVVHFHNTFPLVSPASYWAVRRRGAAVVQTLHNFRLLCAGGSFYRVDDGVGQVCEACLGRLPLPAVQHACYRGSRAGSAVVATMQVAHRALGSYSRAVDQYIVLTEFGRAKMIEGGLRADLLSIKPNFLAQDPGPGPGDGGYALFVGRLTPGKGLNTLMEAWAQLAQEDPVLPLYIVGGGPMLAELQHRAAHLPDVHILGLRDADSVRTLMSGAQVLIMPPEWYEGFPVTLLEAYAAGLPVLASDIGPLGSLVVNGVTGQKFRPRDPADLARTVREVLARPQALADMRRAARQTYLQHYTAEVNARQQLEVYARALARRRGLPEEAPRAVQS